MSNYVTAVNKVLANEGGFVNHPLDKGGATNWGITQAVYDAWMRKQTGNPNYKSTIDEIKNMPKGNAILIYKENYWDKVGGDQIKKYSTAVLIFDQAVNRGISSAVKQAQRIVKSPADGVIGPATLAAINAMPEAEFNKAYLDASADFYKNLVISKPEQVVFLQGWLNRVEALRNYASSVFGQVNGATVAISGTVIALTGVALYFYFKNKRSA